MKVQTVIIVAVMTTLYYSHVSSTVSAPSKDYENSPLLDEVDKKKAALSFDNRKPSNGYKEKVLIVPSDEKGLSTKNRRNRRHAVSYWGSYGQPPLNPTGPPPGAFSPGSTYHFSRTHQRRRIPITKRKSKYKTKLKPVGPSPFLNKSPCPYKLIAEELTEQQRHLASHAAHSHEHTQLPPLPTTTTTTPAPPTTPPQPPIYTQHLSPAIQPQSQTIFYQPVDPMASFQQQHLNPIQYESMPHELFQSAITSSNEGMQYPLLMDNNGLLFQQQQLHKSSPAYSTLSLPSQQQQYILKSDMSSASPLILNQLSTPQHGYLQEQLQPVARMAGGGSAGLNQFILERQAQQFLPQHLSANFPQSLNQQQQQYILLDNPTQNSHVAPAATTAIILPSGQVVQAQTQQQMLQSQKSPLVLLNTQAESPALQLLQQPSYRTTRLNLANSNSPILSDISSILDAGGRLSHQNNRLKTPQIPIFLQPPAPPEDDDEEENLDRVIYQSHKKTRRPERERKRFIVIPKKELDKLKNKKLANTQPQRPKVYVRKNFPPPPEVVHIPSYPDEEDEYESENDSGDQSKDAVYNGPLPFSGSHQQQQHENAGAAHTTLSSSSSPESNNGSSSDNNPVIINALSDNLSNSEGNKKAE